MTAAAYDGRLDILQLLLDAGADVNSPNGWALQTAAEEGHKNIVEELLKRGAEVNSFTTNDNFAAGTALQGAAESGKQEIVALLLQHSANPNLGGGEDAPLIFAVAGYAEEEILAMLIDAKADVNVFGGEDHSTPLISAAEFIAGTESLRKLLDAGADINLANEHGETALIAAAREGDDEVVKFLLDNGADVMHSADDGINALKAALQSNDNDCITVLVEHVSSILSALKSARDSGNLAVTAVIRTATASAQGLNYDDPSHESEPPAMQSAADGTRSLQNRTANIPVHPSGPSFSAETHTISIKPAQPAEEFASGWEQYTATYEQAPGLPPLLPPKTLYPATQRAEEQPYPAMAESRSAPPPQQLYHEYGRSSPGITQNTLGSSRQGTPVRRKPAPGVGQYAPNSPLYPGALDSNSQIRSPPPPNPYQPYTPGFSASPSQGFSRPADISQETYTQNPASVSASAYPGQSRSQGTYPDKTASPGSTATFSPYQDISSYDRSRRDDSVDSSYRNMKSSYSSYTRDSTPPVQSQRPPPNHSYSAPAKPQQQQQQGMQTPPPLPNQLPSAQHSVPYIN